MGLTMANSPAGVTTAHVGVAFATGTTVAAANCQTALSALTTWVTTTLAPTMAPSSGPATRLLEEDGDDNGEEMARQLGAHMVTNLNVGYTLVADEAGIAAIDTALTAHDAAAVMAALNAAVTGLDCTAATVHTTADAVSLTVDAAGDSSALKSLPWLGLALAASSVLV